MPEPIDSVDDGNCQPDMRTDGMMTGDATLPPRLARLATKRERGLFAEALAAALRSRDPIETTPEDNQ